MKSFKEMTKEELLGVKNELQKEYDELKKLDLNLNMMRGNPSPDQLSLSNDLYEGLMEDTGFKASDNSDCRNYGVPFGIPEVRELFASILGTSSENIVVGNSSSLNMMFDQLTRSCLFGECDSDKPWSQIEGRKWLCPAPGYDRHFKVTSTMGFELITVPMTPEGPDMDVVEKLVAEDSKILGMWCVPLYSNPDGYVYSYETCKRLCSMKTAAKDFRIFWDNAYVVHHLYDDAERQGKLPDILSLAASYGNPNRFYEFASTSKITLAGSGLACLATNSDNLEKVKSIMSVQTICTNKVNQLAHVRMLPDLDAVKKRMSEHANILRPKFETVLKVLDDKLTGLDIVTWNKPNGGFFVSVYVLPGTAKATVAMCSELGVKLTPAGATYPYGKDPADSNIRFAPSFPSLEDIESAVTVFTLCAKLTAVNKLLEE